MAKYILYGVLEYENEETDYGTNIGEYRVAIATFDEIEDAQEYVEASKIFDEEDEERPVFKENSLLYGYACSEIEEFEELPNNPTI